MFYFAIESWFFSDGRFDTAEMVAILVVVNLCELAFVTLAPLWLGLLMKINERVKLILIPGVPFLLATIFEFVLTLDGSFFYLTGFMATIVTILTVVTGLAAFVSWVVAWVIFSLDRNYYKPKTELA